jgi:iron complex outermembrane receptor protein
MRSVFGSRGMVSAIALIGACAAGQTAHAAPAAATQQASQLSELVVTAERREVDLQKTAISATVLTAADLEKKGINTVDSLQFTTPSLTVQNTGENALINIRGVGKSEGGIQAPSGVLIYRDGVSASPGGFLADEPYYDIASVEVLRGPQGTLAGENSTGGAIFIRSVDPSLGRVSGWAEGQYGNYNDLRARGAVNLPLSDTLAIRIAANLENRDTFYNLSGPWTGNPGDHHEADGRISLLWQPTDALKVVWKNDVSYIDHGGSPAGPNTGTTSGLFDLSSDAHLKGIEQGARSVLQVGYTFANGISLHSITGYQFGRTVYDLDFDGTAKVFPAAAAPLIYTVTGTDRTASEELNLVSPDKGPFTWVVGAVYQSEKVRIPARGFVESLAPFGTATTGQALQEGYETPKESWGVFGQGSWDLTERLQLQVGARYSDSRMSLSDQTLVTVNGVVLINHPIVDEKESDSRLTGKAALNFKVGERGLLYGFVATGHKSGGINPIAALSAPAGTPAPQFKPEEVTDYELGWKDSFADGRLRTQLDAYRYDYDNFQVSIFDPASVLSQLKNAAGTSVIQGVEGQAQGAFGDFSFDLGVAYLDSKLGTFSAIDARHPTLGLQNLTGRTQSNAPEWTFNAGAQYTFHMGSGDTLTPRIDYGMVSSRWATLFEVSPTDRLRAQNLVNAQIAYERGDSWRVTAYATNLLDLHYVSSLSLGNLANAGPPRQFGLRVSKTF